MEINWHEIQQQIPYNFDPNHPLQYIQTSFDAVSEEDPYTQIEMHLDQYLENLKKQLQELSR